MGLVRHTVHLRVLKDGELFLSRTLAPGRRLTLGPVGSCTIPTDCVDQPLDLLVPGSHGYWLRLAPPLDGELRVDGRTLRVHDGLLADPRPEPLVLGDGAEGQVCLADGVFLEFTIHRIRRRFSAWPRPDVGLCAAMIIACLLLGGAMMLVAPWKGDRLRRTEAVRLVQQPRIARRLARFHRSRSAVARRAARASNRAPLPRRDRTHRVAKARPEAVLQRGVLGLLGQLRRRHPELMGRKEGDSGLLSRLDRSLASVSGGLGPDRMTDDRLVGLLDLPSSAEAPTAAFRLPVDRPHSHARRTVAASKTAPTREEIRKVVVANGGQVRLCYEREMLSSSKPLEGRLLLRWSVDVNGRVVAPTIVKDTVGSPHLGACVLSRIQTWIFPPCDHGGCVVVYPFDFYPSTVNPT